ncbi:MAG: NHL repeat-containing protein, partial [Nitrospinota bacterium]
MKGNPDAATLSGEISRYLEDVSDAKAREGALEKARESGIGKLAAISHLKTFHSGEDLSPVSGIAVAKDGRIFVSDEFNHRVLVYSPEFEQIAEIGSEGAGDGQFKYPRGLALSDDGGLYVADAWNHRVAVFGPDLKFNKNIGSLGEGLGRLDEPVGVVFFNGRLCVLEKSNHRIQAFDEKGNSVGTIGRRGSVGEQEDFYLTDVVPENFCRPVFEFPSSIATDGAGSLYVADTNNHRVVKLDSAWNDDSSFRLGGVRYPIGVACDAENNVHLVEFNREGVSVYSLDGALLYRYAPGDIQTPVAIASALGGGGKTFVGGGMKAAVSAMGIEAEHDSRAVVENRFSHAFKDALSAFRGGDFGEALDALSLAAQAVEKPSAADFTALLPEDDYSFAAHESGEGGFDSPEKAEVFLSLLGGFREEVLDGIDKALDEKLDAGKNLNRISLELEKEVLSGRESNEALMVERFRATKKLLSVSSEIKKKFYSLKKLDEFLQRLAAAGLGAGERLEQIKNAFALFARWKAVRNELYSNAERLAPSLSFASPPEERAEFCENEIGLSALGYEYSMLWRTCAGYNRELAALFRRTGAASEELLWASVDFFAFCAEGLNIRLEYLLSLEELIESFGAEELASVLGGMKGNEHWDIVGREDNIPTAASGTAYRLMPALWADAGYAPREKIGGDTWEKIVDFYNSEFRKFLNENSPLCAEFVRNEQIRRVAEKGDPKQAAMLHRKTVLLGFHKLFQERYIGGMMAEYMIRFSLFALSENPLPGPQVETTEKVLEKLISEASRERFKAETALAGISAKRADSSNLDEKNRLEVEANVIELGRIYHECLAAHLRIIRARLCAKKGGGARPFRLKDNFYG